ncbi:troponin C-like isoform X2 [Homalodisca vitripennis]|nr:troponin C-like isoform X2 [Homalodisca vitripennis]
MRKGFMMIDIHKTGSIETSKIAEALNKMGLEMFDEEKLEELIDEVDVDETGKVDFDQFCQIVGTFLEEEDAEAMQAELKEAFRLYDKEGNGYITTKVLREILAALDDALKPEDLDGMIAEIDTDGSGTVDFEEFMEMMTGE